MKTQNGRKINTQVPAERRGGLLPAIFVEFLGLAADSSRFRSDFCAVPCGRGRLFAEVHITDMSRGSQGVADAFRS